MNTGNEARLGVIEASPKDTESLVRRLERLSSMRSATDQAAQTLWQRAFRGWLALSPSQQLQDLRSHFNRVGWDAGVALSHECYEVLVPSSATEVERCQFSCGVQVALASLRGDRNSGRALARRRVRRMLELARQHRGTLPLEGVARALDCSGRQLARLFTQRTGLTFRRYSLLLRMLQGAELLRDTSEPVKSVAGKLGYADAASFVREFHRTFGMPPGEFRDSCGFGDRQQG